MIRAFAASIVLLAATPALALEDADYSAAVAEIAKEEIIPRYERLEEEAENLRDKLDALCRNPSYGALKEAQYKFVQVVDSWAGIQFISFGPIGEHQRAFRIEYWPDKRNVVGRQLAEVLKKQDEAALEPQRFATTTVGVQGLPALERLLFEKDAQDKLAKDAPEGQYRCRLLQAIALNIHSIARDILAGWTEGDPSFLSRIERPSADAEDMSSGRDAATRLLNDLLTGIIVMRDMKLLPPLGDNLEKAKPQAVEFWRSGHSSLILKENVRSLHALFGRSRGLGRLLSATQGGEVTAIQMEALFQWTINATYAIREPLDKSVADPALRPSVEALAQRLAELRDLLAGPVATTLNLPIGFNALDGD